MKPISRLSYFRVHKSQSRLISSKQRTENRRNLKGKKKKKAERSGTSRHVSQWSHSSQFDLMTYNTNTLQIERREYSRDHHNPSPSSHDLDQKKEGRVLSTRIPWPRSPVAASTLSRPWTLSGQWSQWSSPSYPSGLRRRSAKPDYTSSVDSISLPLGVGHFEFAKRLFWSSDFS
jgi:hypothetical protein